MDSTPDSDTGAAFGNDAPLDSIEAERAEASVAGKLFGSAVPVSVGRFRVLDRIGTGGMGIVYAAWDPQLERRVAIKVLRVAGDQERARRRLLAEARAAARLAHPNVVTVHDAGTDDGRVWVAMEFVEGQTLGAWMKTERSVEQILAVFREAGRGLRAAHQAGLVHRDFKPANVLLSQDEAGRVRTQVADFGLAAITEPVRDAPDSASLQITALTRDGEVLGTPAYMSPEQHRGEPSDARSDQYSFCAALYQALTGSLPFEGETYDALRRAVLEGALPRSPRGVPRRVEAALARGLSRDPDARFEDMGALLDLLQPRAGRGRIAVGALAIAALLGVAVASSGQEGPAGIPPPCQELDMPWARSVGGADALRHALADADVPAAEAIAASTAANIEAYHDRWLETRGRVCRATHVDGTQSADLLDQRMACLDMRRREIAALTQVIASDPKASVVNASVDAFEQVDPPERCEKVTHDRDSPQLEGEEIGAEYSELLELQALFRLGRYREGLPRSRALVQSVRSLANGRLLGLSLELLVAFASRNGKVDEANEAAQEALSMAIETRRPDIAADLAVELVWLEGYVRGDYPAAERIGSLGLAWATAANRPRSRARLTDNLGVVAFLAGDPALAEQRHREAVAIEATMGDAYPATSIRLAINLSAALIEQAGPEQLAEAERLLVDSIEAAERTYGGRHPYVALLLHNYALRRGGDAACTHHRAELERALSIKIENFGESGVPIATTLSMLATCQSVAKEYDAAAKGFAKVVEIRTRVGGPQNPQLRSTYLNWGMSELYRGDLGGAEALYRKGMIVVTESEGADSVRLHPFRFRLGELTAARGDTRAAIDEIEAAIELAERDEGSHSDRALYQLSLAQLRWPEQPERALQLARTAAETLAADPTLASDAARAQAWIEAPKPWKRPGA